MPKTLLLADDSVTIQKVVGITFANEDVELVTVDNGDDALVRARQLKPDLVLADIGMPGLDGYALCGAIRKDPTIARTPVLLLTGTFETYDEEKARQVGANGYISKPFEAQALVDRVFAMLAESAARPAPPVAPPAPAPRPAAPAQAARPMAAPAAPPNAPPAAQAPAARPRPELPPVPNVAPPRPARPSAPTPRPVEPFEFDVPPAAAPQPMQSAPPLSMAEPAPAEPVWEAEPELELEAQDDSPVLRAALESELPDFTPPPAPAPVRAPVHAATPAPAHAPTTAPSTPADATRLFAPDLLGRPARLPDVPEPPAAPRPARANFSFEDLDFEEPTGSPANQTQIFGESSDKFGEDSFGAMPDAPQAGDGQDSPLADPLYSQTKFLDPLAATRQAGPKFDTPNPAVAPPLPDLLGTDEITEPAHAIDELELSEVEPELDAQPLDDPFAAPFSPETAAALDAPEFAPVSRAHAESPRENATTRLMMQSDAPLSLEDAAELEPELVDAEPMQPELAQPEPMAMERVRPAPMHAEPDPRPSAPVVSRMPVEVIRAAAPMIDSAILSQTLEKVAWEAFGSLSEQVVTEVRKRVEAVVWEVVPQLCERLIREEIARLKSELPE